MSGRNEILMPHSCGKTVIKMVSGKTGHINIADMAAEAVDVVAEKIQEVTGEDSVMRIAVAEKFRKTAETDSVQARNNFLPCVRKSRILLVRDRGWSFNFKGKVVG